MTETELAVRADSGEAPLSLDALEALAKAATPGPWRKSLGSVYPEGRQPGWEPLSIGDGVAIDARWPILAGENHEADAAFIAALDPTTVLRLIAAARSSAVAGEAVANVDAALWQSITARTARMGSCSQAHHEHLAADAARSLRSRAVASQPELDVERLTEALFEAERPGDWPTWADYIDALGSPGVAPWRRKAERIAAEYARLSR